MRSNAKEGGAGRRQSGAAASPSVRHRRRSDRADGTRERIIEAALFQFAEFGLFGASLRDISEMSSVPLSALHYHFGSKEDLFVAAVEQVFRQLTTERIERLHVVETSGDPSLEAVLRAFIAPMLSLASTPTGPAYVRLQARIYDAQELGNPRLEAMVLEATSPFRRAIARALPGLPQNDLIRGYRALVRDVSNTTVDPAYEALTGEPALPAGKELDALVDLLVRYHAAGLRALSRRP